MILTYLLMVFIIMTGTICNQCPTGRNSNIIKSITYDAPDATFWRLNDMQYDSETDQYIYLNHVENSNQNSSLLSRIDSNGSLIWNKSYNFSGDYQIHLNTLQYSPENQMLLYLLNTSPNVLVKANSSNGNITRTYQISGSDYLIYCCLECRLSSDGRAYFCNHHISVRDRYILRFDTTNERIDIFRINNTNPFSGVSILPISDYQIFYSYSLYSSPYTYHLIHANYSESAGSYYLNEQYHQTIDERSTYNSASSLGENNNTIWHAINFSTRVLYFQLDMTNFSLIGSKRVYLLGSGFYAHLRMDVGEGIACITFIHSDTLLLIINTTTQDMIQVYDDFTPNKPHQLIIQNGYIEIMGCASSSRSYCYHKHIQASNGLDNLPSLTKRTSNSSSITDDYSLTNQALTNHAITSYTNPSPYTYSNDSYTMQIISDQSYIVALLSSYDQSLTVSPGQTITVDLPCRLDNFDSSFSCEIMENLAPTLISIDCANSHIEIQQIDQENTLSSYFSIKSTYQEGEFLTNFSITIVPCYYSNCDSCFNGICDRCSTGYEWKNENSTCILKVDFRYGPIYKSSMLTIMAQVIAGTGICLCLVIALLRNTPAQDAWAIIHFLQLVLILPLIAKFIDDKVKNFIVSNAIAALSIYILPKRVGYSLPLIKDLTFDQPDEYLKSVGWPSGSTLVNNLMLLTIVLVISIIHLVIYFVKKKQCRCNWIILKVYKFFTLNLYLRIAIEVYLFTVLMLLSEIKYYTKNGGGEDFGHQEAGESKQVKGNYASTTISCLMLILPISFLMLAYISWRRNKHKKSIDKCKTREFYHGILKLPEEVLHQQEQETNNDKNIEDENAKSQELHSDQDQDVQNQSDEDEKSDEAKEVHNDGGQEVENEDHEVKDEDKEFIETSKELKDIKIARLYSMIFLARRLIIVLVAVLIPSSQSLFSLKILFLLFLQTIYTVYVIFNRSFEKIKDQVIEVINEVVFFVLIILLINFYSQEQWTDIVVYLYIGVILSQLLILSIVSIVYAVLNLIRFIKQINTKKNTDISEADQSGNLPGEDNIESSQNRLENPQDSKLCIESVEDQKDLIDKEKGDENEIPNYVIM